MKVMPTIKYAKGVAEFIVAEAHVDPRHNDIVFNGYGITRKQAKQIRDWLTEALRKTKR